jgi:hypothetical protein
MAKRKLGPSSGKCSKCGGHISINPPRPCRRCSGEKPQASSEKKERVFTESEVKAMVREILAEQERLHISDGSGGHDIVWAVGIGEVEAVFKAHGIVLDPA